MRRIRSIFLTGVILSLPALVTLYILWIGFVGVDGLVGRVVREVTGRSIPGVGVVTFAAPDLARADATRAWQRVFVPTTPNPTSGFLVIVPADEVTHTRFTVQQGMKMIVSGGVLWPSDLEGGGEEGSTADGRAHSDGWKAKGE